MTVDPILFKTNDNPQKMNAKSFKLKFVMQKICSNKSTSNYAKMLFQQYRPELAFKEIIEYIECIQICVQNVMKANLTTILEY